MRVYLSYSSVDKAVAETIQLALLGAGHQVFFDKKNLPPGSDYNSRIRAALLESDMFIFLISPNSVRRGRYVQTELKLAKNKWPKPWGAVLPVMIAPTDYELIDPYLAAASVLEPSGNIAAEVIAALQAPLESSPKGPTVPDAKGIPEKNQTAGGKNLLGAAIVGIFSLAVSFGVLYLIVLALAATNVLEFPAATPDAKLVAPLYLLLGLAVVSPVSSAFGWWFLDSNKNDPAPGCLIVAVIFWYGIGVVAIAVTNYLAPNSLKVHVVGCVSWLLLTALGLLSSIPLAMVYVAFDKIRKTRPKS